MTNYKQEQIDELEAIESIYSEEIDNLGDCPHRFTIPVKTEDYDEEEGEGRLVLIKFTFTTKYPDEKPLVEFEDSENIDDEHLDELMDHINTIIEENLGMQMTFSLVSGALDWLNEKNDQIKEDIETARVRKKDLEDEEERKKLEGTKVTIESFLAWKAEFDEERLAKLDKKEREKKKSDKLNGRELFLRDATLNDSDIKFLASAGDTAVTVDESLFEDMDDLDLEDEESDDPDYNPGDESD